MVELLAPAGTYDSFLGALNAGANAIYLGGEKYSARAYADNFTTEQIVKAIETAHLHHCKVYLTLNTLLKETEISEVAAYVSPIYRAGLDGVIVQDFGVVRVLHQCFPDLELHASTQMTITGVDGARFAYEYGFTRIVPARELSLSEIHTIKEQVPVEVECFIHGAMCYGYSGQCLFSSILGGRSGNRGRCAGPCRLPYRVEGQGISAGKGEEYPISMKDMCVLYRLPELIEAGIDSFKIEGRMKSPAYAAGVTALYRKYIDLYEKAGKKGYRVEPADIDTLMHLYIRSEISDGYYDKHNGGNMITLDKPSYLATDDALADSLTTRYVKEPEKLPVAMTVRMVKDQPLQLTVSSLLENLSVTGEGPVVQPAKQRPLTEEQIKDVMLQLGNTEFCCDNISVSMEQDCFLPVGQLKELRRQCIKELTRKLLNKEGYGTRDEKEEREERQEREKACPSLSQQTNALTLPTGITEKKPKLHVTCKTMEQFRTLLPLHPARLYVDSDLWMTNREEITISLENQDTQEDTMLLLSLPFIKRLRDDAYFTALEESVLDNDTVSGFLAHNTDELYYGLSVKQKRKASFLLVGDSSLYAMNPEAVTFLETYLDEVTLPLELNYQELRSLGASTELERVPDSLIIYGWIPMLVSANCVRKTSGNCNHKTCLSTEQGLVDRYQKKFPVYNNCEHCYNVIYNSVPLSLHTKWKQILKMNPSNLRMDFVYEDALACQKIYQYFHDKLDGADQGQCPIAGEYTTGHFTRGIL